MYLDDLWNNLFRRGGMENYLENLTPVDTIEDLDLIRQELDGIMAILENDPMLIADSVLDALATKGMGGDPVSYGDHVNRDHPIPPQEASLYVIRCLEKLSSCVENQGRRVIERIERIAEHSPDLDARRQAIASLWLIGGSGSTANPFSIEALERQAKINSRHIMRTNARRLLLEIAKKHEEGARPALDALRHGMEDQDPIARRIAVSLMVNRVKSPTCSPCGSTRAQNPF